MMDGWTRWMKKKVFLRLKNNRVYSGVIVDIDESANPIIFLTIKDKFDKIVTFVTSEIVEIKEDKY